MTHWKLTLAYDGTPFHGWQIQPSLPTVQGTLAAALHHLTGESVLPQGSGRTDTGVHALAQVASFSLTTPIPPANLLRALNRSLPAAIRVLSAEHASPHFHARHSALRKTYEYRIFPGARSPRIHPPRICPPFLAPFVWDCPWPIDLALARQAADHILGTHDFTSFAAVDPDRTARNPPSPGAPCLDSETWEVQGPSLPLATRTIFSTTWHQENGLLLYRVIGSGFLHHMVRNLVGTFVDIASGRTPPDAIPAILAARDRSAAGPTAPARGLFLVSVDYEADPGIPHLASKMWGSTNAEVPS